MTSPMNTSAKQKIITFFGTNFARVSAIKAPRSKSALAFLTSYPEGLYLPVLRLARRLAAAVVTPESSQNALTSSLKNFLNVLLAMESLQ